MSVVLQLESEIGFKGKNDKLFGKRTTFEVRTF